MIYQKSYAFAIRIVKVYKYLCQEKKEYVLTKQLLRSGTSIGANCSEAKNAQSTSDFINKLSNILYSGLYNTSITIKLHIQSVNVNGMSAIIYETIFIGNINQFVIRNTDVYIIVAKTLYKAKIRGFFAFLSRRLIISGI